MRQKCPIVPRNKSVTESKKCRACGVDVQSNAPFGHCPHCLLGLGFGDAAGDPPEDAEHSASGAQCPNADQSVPVREASGDYIDRYKLLQKIGEGGCGVVYMAEQEEPIRRRVALKVIKAGMDTRVVIARFEAERQALAMMDHPNIAKVLDVGQTATGRPFFVMELVMGVHITDFSDQNNLSTRDRLRLFSQVCHAIQHAHQKGIIHRDIKPSNILVTLHDGAPVPKVIDFGIAKAINQQQLTDLTLFTPLGQFIGTPAYMSPEQAEMGGLDIDTRCDIYTLGVLLYELLVGRTPFDSKRLFEAGLDEMRRIIREQEPLRPSMRLSALAAADLGFVAGQRRCDPARLSHLVRGDLDWIVMRCLEKDRTRRYATSNGLAADIQRHLQNEPVLARPPSNFYRLQKTMRRHRLAFAAALSVVVAVLSGLGLATWMFLREKSARERAEHAEAAAITRLHEANLSWVRANRLTGQPGQRFASLDEVTRGAAHTNRLDLRNEAVACLTLPDFRPLKQWARSPGNLFSFSPTLRSYATNDAQGELTIRDTSTDAVHSQLGTHGARLSAAITSEDARFLATSDMDGRAHLWDLHTQIAQRLLFPRGAALLTFTPDSRSLVVRHNDGKLHFLSVTNGLEARSIPALARVPWIRFDHSGDFFLTLIDGQARIYRANDGQFVRALDAPVGATDGIRQAAWHPNGRYVGLAWMSLLGIWDAETGHQLTALEGHEGPTMELAFTETGEWLISTSWDHTTRIWNTDMHREAVRLPDSGNGLRLSPEGTRLAFKSWDHTRTYLYELALPAVVQRFNLPQPTRSADSFTAQAAFSPGGELVAAVDKQGIYLFQPPDPSPIAHLPGDESYTVQFQPDGTGLLMSGKNGVCRWPMEWSADRAELRLGPPSILEPTRGQMVNYFDLSRDGSWLVAATKKHFFSFDPKSASQAIFTDAKSQPDTRPYISPDGRLVASSDSNRIQIWNPRTGVILTSLPIRKVQDASFSPDGVWLACADEEATTFWNTRDWKLRHRIPHEAPAHHRVVFSPDSRVAAVSSADRKVKLMMVETGEELATVPTGGLLSWLAFSPEGQRLAVISEAGYFQLWDLLRLRKDLSTMNLDWPDIPLPTERVSKGKLRVTIVSDTPIPSIQ
jgi:serine/threonine protein kinase/WD40 repeat protein